MMISTNNANIAILFLLTLLMSPFFNNVLLIKLTLTLFTTILMALIFSSSINLVTLTIYWLITFLWSFMVMRWTSACVYFNQDATIYRLIRWSSLALMSLVLIESIIQPNLRGKEMLIVCPIMMTFWYGAGNYYVYRYKSVLISILLPTLLVIKQNNYPNSIPYLTNNLLCLMAYMAFDKSKCILDLYPQQYPHKCDYSLSNYCRFMQLIVKAFFTSEPDLAKETIDDYFLMQSSLARGSKATFIGLAFLESGVRIDLTIMSGFIRFVDDYIDDACEGEQVKNLQVLRKYLDELVNDRNQAKWDYDLGCEIDASRKLNIDWNYYQNVLPAEKFAAFRAFSKIAYYMPSKSLDQLYNGYVWDAKNEEFQTQHDMLNFDYGIGPATGVMGFTVMWYKSGHQPNGLEENQLKAIEYARLMCSAGQVVNNARDIIPDSEKYKKCLIPLEYLIGDDYELIKNGGAKNLSSHRLKYYALKMINFIDPFMCKAFNVSHHLPKQSALAMYIVCKLYQEIIEEIRKFNGYQARTRVPKLRTLITILKGTYFLSFCLPKKEK